MKFHTEIEDDDGNEHNVVVEYNWTTPRHATHWEPAEGGVEIDDVICDTLELSADQIDMCEQRCVDAAWETYHEVGCDRC